MGAYLHVPYGLETDLNAEHLPHLQLDAPSVTRS